MPHTLFNSLTNERTSTYYHWLRTESKKTHTGKGTTEINLLIDTELAKTHGKIKCHFWTYLFHSGDLNCISTGNISFAFLWTQIMCSVISSFNNSEHCKITQ